MKKIFSILLGFIFLSILGQTLAVNQNNALLTSSERLLIKQNFVVGSNVTDNNIQGVKNICQIKYSSNNLASCFSKFHPMKNANKLFFVNNGATCYCSAECGAFATCCTNPLDSNTCSCSFAESCG